MKPQPSYLQDFRGFIQPLLHNSRSIGFDSRLSMNCPLLTALLPVVRLAQRLYFTEYLTTVYFMTKNHKKKSVALQL
jgi:hypothetical protein